MKSRRRLPTNVKVCSLGLLAGILLSQLHLPQQVAVAVRTALAVLAQESVPSGDREVSDEGSVRSSRSNQH